MSEWLSYSPADLLLFSPRVYYRLLEMHNAAWWPLHIIALAAGCVLAFLIVSRTPSAERWIGGLLGVLWIWVAWSFLWERFATIHWIMAYVAPLFAIQGIALFWFGGVRGGLALSPANWQRLAAAVVMVAAILYPLLALAEARPLGGGEVLGLFPDPTAIATLAALSAMRKGLPLMILPAAWCALSSETLWLLQSPGYFVPAAAAGVALIIHLAGRFAERHSA
jgi:hypothetical protein